MKLETKKKCPHCKSTSYRRIKRKWWMAYIPKMKHYECRECYGNFTVLWGVTTALGDPMQIDTCQDLEQYNLFFADAENDRENTPREFRKTR